MSKFTRLGTVIEAPIRTVSAEPDTATAEGGAGWNRDAKSELFLLALTNMVSEDTFYESGKDRDSRFESLIHQVTREDPGFVRSLVPFMRDRLHLRSASLVAAAEYVKAGGKNGRTLVSAALQRADEPAEMLAYWQSRHGRNIPQPIKRGVADAVQRLFNERAALKYDGTGQPWRMADVLELVHPEPVAPWQGALFKYLLDKRHNRENIDWPHEALPIVTENAVLEWLPVADRRAVLDDPERLARAGFTWERLSGWLQGPMDAQAWEAIIPSMGYMALLRNLRNFDDAKISGEAKARVNARIADPEEVRKSRQMPLRFYSAWAHTEGLSYGQALESALDACLGNVPSFKGKTLVLIDVSGSMNAALSARSKALRWQIAALFGLAISTRAEKADVYAYDYGPTKIHVRPGTSILRGIDSIRSLVGGGTNTFGSLDATYKDHERVVILTDEQAFPTSGYRPAPADQIKVPIYTFNLAGYKAGHLPSGKDNRYTFGGLTDAAFDLIPLLEQHRSGDWSFLAA